MATSVGSRLCSWCFAYATCLIIDTHLFCIYLFCLHIKRAFKSTDASIHGMSAINNLTSNLAVMLGKTGKVILPCAYMKITAFLEKAEKECSEVVSTMIPSLEVWANPIVRFCSQSN